MTSAAEREIDRQFDALFDRVMRLSDTELRLLRLGWEEVDPSLRESAWDAAHAVIARRRRQKYVDDARSALSRWAGSLSHASVPFGHAEWISTSGMATSDVRRDAIPAILDAVAAIVAADGLTFEERHALLGPINRLDARGPRQ